MELVNPQLLWLLALAPLAGVLVGWAWRRRLAAAAAWAARGLWDRLLPGYRRRRVAVSAVSLAVAVAAVVLALARPRWGAGSVEIERRGVDVVFVLDTSLSMAARDVQPDRLWVAQTLIRRLVRAMPENRVALVQAEGDGVAMVPLTADGAVMDLLLDAVLPGSLPLPGTQLARALDRALALFPAGGSRHQVVVLVSDGEDHGSGLDRVAAKLRSRGVVLHAIGVGTREGTPLEVRPASAAAARRAGAGSAVEYKRDGEGNVVVSRLMEEAMESLSRETGGVYVRATSPAAILDPITARIEDMEKRSYGSELLSTREERFQWPASLAIVALSLHLLIAPFRRVRGAS